MKEYKVIIENDGTKRYFKPNTNVLHNEDGPAIEYQNGDKSWYIDGELHREDGPAVEYPDGTKYWYINGKRHNENGPAVVHANGNKEWYLNGKEITESEFNNRNKVELTLDEIAKKFNININQLKIKK